MTLPIYLSFTFAFMSGGEIILILFIYLLLFGAKGVPALAQTMGKALYQFRNATKDVQNEIMKSANEVREQAGLRLDQMDIDSTPVTPKKTNETPAATPQTPSGSSATTEPE